MKNNFVYIRFYEELNDFLPEDKRRRDAEARYSDGATVKSIIEGLGVPHTEVDLVLVNGESQGFSYLLRPFDRISVYPMFESFDVAAITKVRPVPLRVTRFVCDVHLGKLAKELRLCGFDTLYSNSYDDPDISFISFKEKRVLLTRDRGLLKRKIVSHGYLVRSKQTQNQLHEVILRFNLEGRITPFSRCLVCNLLLDHASKESVRGIVPPKVEKNYDRFSRCPGCGKIFWRGTHWEHMEKRILAVSSGQLRLSDSPP